jgi:hypothetical protein
LKQVTKRTLLIFGTGIVIIVIALLVGNGIYSSTVDSATKHMATGKAVATKPPPSFSAQFRWTPATLKPGTIWL